MLASGGRWASLLVAAAISFTATWNCCCIPVKARSQIPSYLLLLVVFFLIIYNNSVLHAPALHVRHNLTGAERGTLDRVSASPDNYHFEIIGARRICGCLIIYMKFSLLTYICNQRIFTPSASFKAGIESTTDSPLDRWNRLHKLSLQSSHFRRIVRTPSA